MSSTATERSRPELPDDWVFVDLEVTGDGVVGGHREGGRVAFIGALRGSEQIRLNGSARDTVERLERFVMGARLLVAHNGWLHDRRFIETESVLAPLREMPLLDTLPLSVLTKPERPYHSLVKDYKLVRTSMSDPVEDCALARQLLLEEMDLLATKRSWAQMFALRAIGEADGADRNAIGALVRHLGIRVPPLESVASEVMTHCGDTTCRTALGPMMEAFVSGGLERQAAAYAISWLSVAGTSSVLPRWVREQFPDASALVRTLRDTCCADEKCTWCRETNDETRALQRWFGFEDFRATPALPDGTSLQRAIVRNGLRRKPTFAVLPTGGGKSICFQIPAFVRGERTGALTVVVSPLQSLMKDQVDNVSLRVPDMVGHVSGALTMPERARTLEGVRNGRIALLYVSPEQLRNMSVREALSSREIAAWVFDEAHCLSAWGHDFRTDYVYAPHFIAELADVARDMPPVFCLTATAQRKVIAEVCDVIHKNTGQTLTQLIGGVERDNLTFEVRKASPHEKLGLAAAYLREYVIDRGTGSAVVFAATRRETEETARGLSELGIAAKGYHAGLEAHERRSIQDEFIGGACGIIVATSAFGMGVDKDNVRLVVHLSMPGALEAYLQQAGRAGRDRQPAHCVLLYDEGDADTQFRLALRSRLYGRDIDAIWRSISRAKCSPDRAAVQRDGETSLVKTVATHAELMRVGKARDYFDPDDSMSQTRVSTAISWLERAKLVARGENENRVFQGRLATSSLGEAKAKLRETPMSDAARARMERVLDVFALADVDEAMSADDIAARAKLWGEEDGTDARAGEHVVKLLRDLVDLRILRDGTQFTAFIDHEVRNSSAERFVTLRKLDTTLLSVLEQEHSEAAAGDVVHADFRVIRRAVYEQLGVMEDGKRESALMALWLSYGYDGTGFDASDRMFSRRSNGADRVVLRLERGWEETRRVRSLLFAAARVTLDVISESIAPNTKGSNLLVDFSVQSVEEGLERDAEVGPRIRRVSAVSDAVLLLLHDAKVLTLQSGLAVFRQAMTLRYAPENRRKSFTRKDYRPLEHHYAQRIRQIHVMHEYARSGVTDMSIAKRLARDWFEMDEREFYKSWFPSRTSELKLPASPELYERITDALGDERQLDVVCAPDDANQLVLAGPGSGKTRTIVHRIAYLVRIRGFAPEGIFALAYNRAAAHEIRKRLVSLIGVDGRFVRVHTLHALATRLMEGLPKEVTDVTADAERATRAFDQLLGEAATLLEGPEGDSTHLRETFLGGCTHLVIDEYQDVNEPQARLVRALAGKLESDARKLSVLAVGDDDQNIYGFQGADNSFIQTFSKTYNSETYALSSNYRSTRAIVEATNRVIEEAPSRLKRTRISVNTARDNDPFGGQWEALDPVGRGRVRIVECDGMLDVGDFIAAETLRLHSLSPEGSPLESFAALAQTRAALHPVREAFRLRDTDCRWSLSRRDGFPLAAVREIVAFQRALAERAGNATTVSALREEGTLPDGGVRNPWTRFLHEEVERWEADFGNELVPVSTLLTALSDAVFEQRSSLSFGSGVNLLTIHGAKGLEFPHVFVAPERPKHMNDDDAERRLFYVGLTRAKETLTVVVPRGLDLPWIRRLASAPGVERAGWTTQFREQKPSKYILLGLSDLWLDMAGRHGFNLTDIPWEAPVTLHRKREHVEIKYRGRTIAALSERGRDKIQGIELTTLDARVLAFVVRDETQSGDAYASKLTRSAWEVPIVELRVPG